MLRRFAGGQTMEASISGSRAKKPHSNHEEGDTK